VTQTSCFASFTCWWGFFKAGDLKEKLFQVNKFLQVSMNFTQGKKCTSVKSAVHFLFITCKLTNLRFVYFAILHSSQASISLLSGIYHVPKTYVCKNLFNENGRLQNFGRTARANPGRMFFYERSIFLFIRQQLLQRSQKVTHISSSTVVDDRYQL